MTKKIIAIIILLTILPVNAGNIYSPKMLIDYASVEVCYKTEEGEE